MEGSGVGSDDEGGREGGTLGISVEGCCVGLELEGGSVGSLVGSPVGLIVVKLGQFSEQASVPKPGPFIIEMHSLHVWHTVSNAIFPKM